MLEGVEVREEVSEKLGIRISVVLLLSLVLPSIRSAL